MNQPSMDFLNYLRPDGVIVYNESLINMGVDRDDVKKIGIPATEIAERLKNEVQPSDIQDTKMFANAVMFGAFLALCAPQIKEDRIKESLKYFLAGKKEGLIPLNYLAIERGMEFVRTNPVKDIKSEGPFHCIPSWAAQ